MSARIRGYEELKAENSGLLRSEIARGVTVHRGLPEIVTLNSTDICNLRCVMCSRSLEQGRYRLEDRVVEFVCDELFPTALKANLTTAGGEPLGPGFHLILERALHYGVRIDVVTNGMLLTGDTFRHMRSALDHLNVSVDCAVPKIYERLRAGASFARLLENLAAVAEVRSEGEDDLLLSMSAVVMTSNLPHLPDLVRFAAAHGAKGLVLQRLRHEVKPTWDEDAPSHFPLEEIEGYLARTEDAAQEVGLNLYQLELGRPNVLVREVRRKIPGTIDDRGICYFLSQSFSIMYTGEVYPCCKPTDHKVGDVHFESPIEIWNGKPLQRLRQAHLSRRGTLFCSGCEYATHLPPRAWPRTGEMLRRGRRAYAHVANKLERGLRVRFQARVFDAPPPPLDRLDAVSSPNGRHEPTVVTLEGRREASAVDPHDGSSWFIAESRLHRAADPLGPAACVFELPNPRGAEAACLFPCSDGAWLVSFEHSGALLRVASHDEKWTVETVLELSDSRSFVRRCGAVRSPAGVLWVGEYGAFPGARCAWVYHSVDEGRSFEAVQHLPRAAHVHALACPPDSERVLATTGDLARERRTYARSAGGGTFRPVLGAWAGFTAIAFSGDYVHFGTDLEEGNGLLRMGRDLTGRLECRPLEGELDLQVRQLEHLGDGRLVALGCMDENLVEQRAVRRAALFLSCDHGAQWSCLHRFAVDWGDAPERFVVLPGTSARIVTDLTSIPYAIEIP